MSEDVPVTVIHGGTVMVEGPDREQPCVFKEGWAVTVSGGRILYAGPEGRAYVPPGSTRYDATGTIVMPGFVNGHSHAAMTLLRGYAQDLRLKQWLEDRIWPAEDRMKPEDVSAGAMLACLEMLESGITTICDMYFYMDEVAEAVAQSGIRALICQGMMGLNTADRKRTRDSTMTLFQKWAGAHGGRVRVILGPHAPYTCPPDFLREVADMSVELNAPVTIHLSETSDEVKESLERYGKTPVENALDSGLAGVLMIAAHGVHVTESDITKLSSTRSSVIHCPVSNLNLGCGIAPVSRLLKAGVPVGLGTDGAASGSTYDMFAAMRMATLAQKQREGDPAAMPASVALWMATRGGALALGIEDAGVLAEGMVADIICVSREGAHFEPGLDLAACLVHCARPSDVEMVMVGGKVLKSGGRVLTLDEASVKKAAREAAARVTGL